MPIRRASKSMKPRRITRPRQSLRSQEEQRPGFVHLWRVFLSSIVFWRLIVVFTVFLWGLAASLWVPGDFSEFTYSAAVSWDGGAATTDWNTAANWNPDGVPTSLDDVTIDSAVNVSTSAAISFNSLTIGDGTGTVLTTTTLSNDITSGGTVTIRNGGRLVQNDTATKTITGTLTIQSGGNLTHTANATSTIAVLDFSVGGLDVQSGGTIDISSLGNQPAYYPTCPSNLAGNGTGGGSAAVSGKGGAGAGHGGNGGHNKDSSSAGGTSYGDFTAPTTIGSSGGGGFSACGGWGGGAAKITITGGGSATVSGAIHADGGDGVASISGNHRGGGGAGGSIWITFSAGGTYTGGGTLTAIGGDGLASTAIGGGGGGGHIAITEATTNSFTGTYSYYGGAGGISSDGATDGGSGTLYTKLSSASAGNLVLSNNNSGDNTPSYSVNNASLYDLTVNSGAYFTITTSTVLSIASSTLGSTSVSTTIDVDGTIALPPSFHLPQKIQLYVPGGHVTGLYNLTIDTGAYWEYEFITTSTPVQLSTLTVNGELAHKANTSTVNSVLYVLATSTITVGSGGYINGTGRGYSGAVGVTGSGPGGGTGDSSLSGGGGAYGGNGGTSDDSIGGGARYGTTSTAQYYAGSAGGGGGLTAGGSGGGIVYLVSSSTISIGGTIRVDGNPGENACGSIPAAASGGGGGGGLYLSASTISGSGSIYARGGRAGGNGGSCGGGGGGGGRMLITASTFSFTGATSTAGGTTNGGTPSATSGTDGSYHHTPTAPTTPYANNSTAQSGQSNPTGLSDTTPAFSSIHNGTVNASSAEIQVSTDQSMSSITHWDSGSSGTAITSCASGARCQDLVYGSFGTAPTQNLSLNDDGSEDAAQTVYYWRMRYFDTESAIGTWSATSTFTLADAPNAPTSLSTSSESSTGFGLSWTDNSSIEDSHELDISTDGVVYVTTSTPAANATSATMSGLSPNTQYTFRIRAVNGAGNSSYATSASLYTLANVPTNVSANAGGSSSITVSWGANGNSPSTSYNVRNETTGQIITGLSTTSYTFTGLTKNTSYTFSALAVNNNNKLTAYSPSVSATTDDDTQVHTGGIHPLDLGGGDKQEDTSPAFIINEGDEFTQSRIVTIHVLLKNISDIALSNDQDFVHAIWQSLPEDKHITWTIPAGAGEKYVFAKFMSVQGGVSRIYRSRIILEENTPPDVQIDDPKEGATVAINLSEPEKQGYQKLNVSGHGAYRNTSTKVTLYRKGLSRNPITGAVVEHVVELGSMPLFPVNVSDAQKKWFVSFSGIPYPGDHRLVLTVTDKTGKELEKLTRDFFIESAQTGVPSENSFVVNGGKSITNMPDVHWNATVPKGRYYWIGHDQHAYSADAIQTFTGAAAGTYRLPTTSGTYTIYFRAFDENKNELFRKVVSITLKVQVPRRPQMYIYVKKNHITIKGTADPLVTVVVEKEDITPQPNPVPSSPQPHAALYVAATVTKYVKVDGTGTWQVDFPDVHNGDYQITAYAIDDADNQSQSVSATVTVYELTVSDEDHKKQDKPHESPQDSKQTHLEDTRSSESKNIVFEHLDPIVPVQPIPAQKPEVLPPIQPSELPDKISEFEPTPPPQIAEDMLFQVTPSVPLSSISNRKNGTVAELMQFVIAFADDPRVEAIVEKAVAPTAAVIAIANVATAMASAQTLPSYLYFIFTQPVYLLHRRRRKAWGVAYNAFTKMPVDLALVRLVDVRTNRVMQTRVTDIAGRFAFFVRPGMYRIEVSKPGYSFPTPVLAGKKEDGQYLDLYHGETIAVEGKESAYVTPSLALNPHEDTRPIEKITKEQTKKIIQNVVGASGTCVAVAASFIRPSVWVIGALGLHIVSYFLFRRLAIGRRPKEWGVVKEKGTKHPVKQAIVRLFDTQYNKLLETQVTTGDGRYAFLVGPNNYYLLYEKEGYGRDKTEPIVIEKPASVIARNEELAKASSVPHVPVPESAELAKEKQPEIAIPKSAVPVAPKPVSAPVAPVRTMSAPQPVLAPRPVSSAAPVSSASTTSSLPEDTAPPMYDIEAMREQAVYGDKDS